MFFEEKLKLLHEKIKLFISRIILPVVIPVAIPVIIPIIAIFLVFFSFTVFSQRILFIYDPYTIKISDYTIPQIKRSGIRHRLFIEPIETTYEKFSEIYGKMSDKEKEKKLVISAYLYSRLKDKEEYKTFFNDKKVYIYGPLFDYEKNAGQIALSAAVSNKTKLNYFLKECSNLVFLIPESIYEKADIIEPEKTLISFLEESLYSQKKDTNAATKKLPLSEKMEKNTHLFESNSIIVLCLRKISPGARSFITESGGKVVFFDYINSRNLKNSLYINKETSFSASLSYDYKDTLDKIFKIMGENSEKGVNYMAVFSFFK